jgi:hypothetical protein
MCATP